jgi:hypothetical protein
MNKIIDFHKPICVACKHFRVNPNAPNNLSLGLCSLYKYKDVITGDINYEFASAMRIFRCKDAKLYEPVNINEKYTYKLDS